jgi:hypothetical protein
MSTAAIVMMLVAMIILWGGLALAIMNISRFRGEEPEETIRDL